VYRKSKDLVADLAELNCISSDLIWHRSWKRRSYRFWL